MNIQEKQKNSSFFSEGSDSPEGALRPWGAYLYSSTPSPIHVSFKTNGFGSIFRASGVGDPYFWSSAAEAAAC